MKLTLLALSLAALRPGRGAGGYCGGAEGQAMKSFCTVIGVASALIAAAQPSRSEVLTLCGQKVDYQPGANLGPASAQNLMGIWIGDMLALNVPYSVDFQRCVALAVEAIGADGSVRTKLVLADSTKNLQTGASYGTQGFVHSWTGQIGGNGATLRVASDNGSSVYDMKVSGSKIEGRVATPRTTNGRVFLSKK